MILTNDVNNTTPHPHVHGLHATFASYNPSTIVLCHPYVFSILPISIVVQHTMPLLRRRQEMDVPGFVLQTDVEVESEAMVQMSSLLRS